MRASSSYFHLLTNLAFPPTHTRACRYNTVITFWAPYTSSTWTKPRRSSRSCRATCSPCSGWVGCEWLLVTPCGCWSCKKTFANTKTTSPLHYQPGTGANRRAFLRQVERLQGNGAEERLRGLVCERPASRTLAWRYPGRRHVEGFRWRRTRCGEQDDVKPRVCVELELEI